MKKTVPEKDLKSVLALFLKNQIYVRDGKDLRRVKGVTMNIARTYIQLKLGRKS